MGNGEKKGRVVKLARDLRYVGRWFMAKKISVTNYNLRWSYFECGNVWKGF